MLARAPNGIRQQIQAAVEEGDDLEAARLWGELVSRNPGDEALRVEEIGALCFAHAWPEAERRAAVAVGDFPHSLYIRLAQANIAYLSFDWGVAIARFEEIRRSYAPSRYRDSLNTALVQIHCCELMSDYEGARRLADAFWPLLRRGRFAFRHESLLLGTLLAPERRRQYLAWISRALPRAFRRNFHRRESLAGKNAAWMRRRAPDVKILSLGQNCLPWMLPNRWGLRPGEIDMNPISPFDYFPAIGDKLAEALDGDFEPLLRESALRPFVTGAKIPGLMNEAMNASFFHETGAWWSENDWARLKGAYRARIARFQACVRRGRILYVYALCGAASLDRIVDSYSRALHDENSRLLIVNLLKEPVADPLRRPGVRMVHAPYPEDYTWTHWEEFTSERGIAFERAIVREMLAEIRDLTGERAEPPPDRLTAFETWRDALARVAFR